MTPEGSKSKTTAAISGDGGDQQPVGYKSPPTATQFQKGRSGYPAGRRKGNLNLRTRLLRRLSAPMTVHENGRTNRIPLLEALFVKAVNEAISKGNYKNLVAVGRFVKDMGLLPLEEELSQAYIVNSTIRFVNPPGDKLNDESEP